MIKFSGEMSEISKNLIICANRKGGTLIGAMIAIFFLIPILILTFVWSPFALLFIIPLVFVVALAGIPPKDLNKIAPYEILTEEFDDGTYLVAVFTDGHYLKKSLNSIKRIIDLGEAYYISFRTRPYYFNFLCQKDLLVEGTLEEFEQLFDGKIIRK